MQQAIRLSDFDATDGACVVCQQLLRFGLVVDIHIVKRFDVLEDLLNDSVATPLREDEVLFGIELEQNVWFIVMNPFDAVVLEIAGTDWGLLAELLAVVFVGNAVAHSIHLFDPVLV